jgi:putative ABC transport system permease protein
MFGRRRSEQALADEMESHLQFHIEDNLRAGMTPERARRDALIKLGGIEPVKEIYRERRGLPMIETLIQDVRYGVRMLAKNPGFTIVAVLTLALGIGANTAIFSVVNAVLLRPLPYPDSGRLMMVWATDSRRGNTEDVTSYPGFEDWRAQSKSFESMFAFTTRGTTLNAGDQAEIIPAVQVTPGFFEMLRVPPAMGRTFRPDESEAGASHVAILSDTGWKTRFAGRPGVLGQTVRINDQPYAIVGVMPPGFRFHPERLEELYTPIERDPNRGHGFLRIVGRLRPGVSRSQAQAEMDIITRRLEKQYPKTDADVGANVMPLTDAIAGEFRIGLLIFLGVVALVLLIACTNVANLMLARNATRQKELAVRAALGASRGRLIQQFLTESTLLALAGGALGLLLANWSARLLVSTLAAHVQLPRLQATHTDAWVLGFTVLVSLATGILFGVLPALNAASPNVNESLRESSRSATESIRGKRIRSVLVITETALALVLLAGAGLLLKSLLIMRGTAPGFRSENLAVVNLSLPRPKFGPELDRVGQDSARVRYFEKILERVTALPGVRAAALVADLPMGGGSDSLSFHIPGRPDPSPKKPFSASFNIVSVGYFRTMETRVLSGREFGEQDSANTPGVIVINDSAARKFWPGEDAVGKQILLPTGKDTSVTLTVAGVTGDVRQEDLGTAPRPEIFLNYMQPGPPWPWLALVVRTSAEPAAVSATIKSAVQSVDHDVPVTSVLSMDEVLSHSMAQPRVTTALLGLFAALALVLAAVGLYGVVSYTATQRTHEVGIRMALGAQRGDVLRLILRQGLVLSIAGVVIGLICALGVTRLLTHLIPGVEPGDPLTLTAVSALLLGVALLASYLPAWRATKVDPLVALRHE